MIKRPLVVFGAAFLITVAAALFAPLLLLFISLPCAFGLLFCGGKTRFPLLIFSFGCLFAIAVSSVFAFRLNSISIFAGTTIQVSGTVFYDSKQQMALVTIPDGTKAVIQLFPAAEGMETGDGVVGTVQVNSVVTDSEVGLLSGGVLLRCAPVELNLDTAQSIPITIRGMMLRDRLCNKLRIALPTATTNTTTAILFSVTEHLSPELRSAFSKSGMSHLLAVSGLHLSILVWTLVGAVKRMGGGIWVQTIVGSGASIFVFFSAGMSPSVTRATIMTLLTLLGGLVSRKSDGLTSLSVAAVILVAISPPVIVNLSFMLSFLSAAGILLLAPRFFDIMERRWIARFSRCGRAAGAVLSSISVSAAAQLATAPVVALQFGTFPLLGIAVNLVAIPLVYPVLILGFSACLGLGILPTVSPALLHGANLFSSLLAFVADTASQMPFCTMPIVFPLSLLPIILLAVIAAAVVLIPHKARLLRPVTVFCTIGIVLSAGADAFINYNSITVASSSVTGSLIVTSRDGTLIIDNAQNNYHRTLDSRLLSRLGCTQPYAVASTYPYDTNDRITAAVEYYGADKLYTPPQLPEPVELLPDVWISVPQPYVTEIAICNTKLMKFYATYDTIATGYCTGLCANGCANKFATRTMRSINPLCGYDTIDKLDSYGNDVLLADRQGNLLSLGGRRWLLRRPSGESFVRIWRI